MSYIHANMQKQITVINDTSNKYVLYIMDFFLLLISLSKFAKKL